MSFVCGNIIYFKDGTSSEQVLHRGTLEECQRISEVCLAVSYSGDKEVDKAQFVIVEES